MKQEDGTSQVLLRDREPLNPNNAPEPRRRSVKVQAIVAIAMLLLIVVGGFLIVKSGSSSSNNNTANAAPTALPKPWCAPANGLSDGFSGNTISGLSTSDVWSLGAQIMYWNGKEWNTMYSAPSSQDTLRSILEIAQNNVWAIGEQQTNGLASHPLIIHWSGRGWETVNAPDASAGGKNSLAAIAGSSPSDLWVVGFYVPKSGPLGVLAEHWNGSTWSVVAPTDAPANAQFTSVKDLAPNNVWAAGYAATMVNGKAVNQPITEHWDGSKWTNVTTPSLTSVGGGSVYAINGSSASDIWIVGSEANGDMLSEHWDGSSWTLEKSPTVSANTSNWLSDVVDLAPNNVWAVGRVASGNNQFQPYVQHWDGTQWLTTQDPNPGAGELDAVTAVGSQVWIVGIPSTSGGHPFIETIC